MTPYPHLFSEKLTRSVASFLAGCLGVMFTEPLWCVCYKLKTENTKKRLGREKAASDAKENPSTAAENSSPARSTTLAQYLTFKLVRVFKVVFKLWLRLFEECRKHGATSLWIGLKVSLILCINPVIDRFIYEELQRHLSTYEALNAVSGDGTASTMNTGGGHAKCESSEANSGSGSEGSDSPASEKCFLGNDTTAASESPQNSQISTLLFSSTVSFFLLFMTRNLFCGMTSKLVATLVTYPLQVMQTKVRNMDFSRPDPRVCERKREKNSESTPKQVPKVEKSKEVGVEMKDLQKSPLLENTADDDQKKSPSATYIFSVEKKVLVETSVMSSRGLQENGADSKRTVISPIKKEFQNNFQKADILPSIHLSSSEGEENSEGEIKWSKEGKERREREDLRRQVSARRGGSSTSDRNSSDRKSGSTGSPKKRKVFPVFPEQTSDFFGSCEPEKEHQKEGGHQHVAPEGIEENAPEQDEGISRLGEDTSKNLSLLQKNIMVAEDIYKTHGFFGFYRGLESKIFETVLRSGLTYTVFEIILKQFL